MAQPIPEILSSGASQEQDARETGMEESQPTRPDFWEMQDTETEAAETPCISEGTPVDPDEWFRDAVLIGDSRTDGFRLYSGIRQGDFLTYNGISTYDIMAGKKVIRDGDRKISVLDALSRKQYGKVYLNLGINELGYYSPSSFQKVYGELIDAVQERQPHARIYIQTIIPINTALSRTHHIPSYVTNEAITEHNRVLEELAAEKQLPLINVSEALTDASGEVFAEYSSDGVHFKKIGYQQWLNYLLTHTGAQEQEV